MTGNDRDALISQLSRLLAAGSLESRFVLLALKELVGGQPPVPVHELADALRGQGGPEVARLVGHIQDKRRRDALACHRLKTAGQAIPEDLRDSLGDLPLGIAAGWQMTQELLDAVRSGLELLRDLSLASRHRDDAPDILAAVEDRIGATVEAPSLLWRTFIPLDLAREFGRKPSEGDSLAGAVSRLGAALEAAASGAVQDFEETPESFLATLPPGIGDAHLIAALTRCFQAASSREKRRHLVDVACSWPTDRIAPVLLEILLEPWAQERADLIFKMRFGGTAALAWTGWHYWLQGLTRHIQSTAAEVERIRNSHCGELLYLWARGQPDLDPDLSRGLRAWCEANVEPASREAFVERWGEVSTAAEWSAISGIPRPEMPVEAFAAAAAEPGVGASNGAAVGEAQPPPVIERAPGEEPPRPRRRSGLWDRHIQPFFVENWYMVAGAVMILVGASLLAYYTWDKSWLLRYTIMPGLLAAFTAALAGVARWIEKKDKAFRGTAAVLRGAAIGLLPINFMTVALLSGDEEARQRILAVPLLGAIYVFLGGWGLSRWCAAVHPPLRWLLGGTLLMLNCLVIVGPLARAAGSAAGDAGTTAGIESGNIVFLLGCGFHAGFLFLATAVVQFSRSVLTRELAEEKRVPWFFGVTLVLTFLQVFAWIHGWMRYLPNVWTYSPMIVLSGWLVLFVERRTLDLRETPEQHGTESFLGFALVLLGVLMGAAEERVRILVFALAGVVWLYQAQPRRQQIHHWIGLTFLALAVASIGLLEEFPGEWIPSLGIAAALGLGGIHLVSRRRGLEDLSRAAVGVQIVSLVVTAVVAALAQWHFRSPPLITAAHLVAVVVLIGWRAHRDQRLRWVHAAMIVLALALPYLGFVDIERQTLQGNTMVFGLAVLSIAWLALIRASRQALLLEARSTVLWIYGSLAVAAMILRVLIERGLPFEPLWYRDVMDYVGPLLMLGVLAFTTYHSRSLVPAAMGIVISAILFPELRNNLRETFDAFGWGSGLGSASSALGLVALCFALRRASFLRDLGPGDLFLGKETFPFGRRDHTLFTWPLIAAALFLIVKVDTWNLARNLLGDGSLVKTATAVAIGGAAWMLLAIYWRHLSAAVAGTHLGWVGIAAGLCLLHGELAETPRWRDFALILLLVPQALHGIFHFGMARLDWSRALLADPVRRVIRVATPLAAVVCCGAIAAGEPIADLGPLVAVVAAQLVWHGLGTRWRVHGTLLFFLGWFMLVAWNVGGAGALHLRIFPDHLNDALLPTLWLILGVHIAHVGLELKRGIHDFAKPILGPFLSMSSLLGVLLGLGALADALPLQAATPVSLALLVAALALTARAQVCAPAALLAALVAYVLIHSGIIRDLDHPLRRLILLGSPWRVSFFTLILVTLGHAGRRVAKSLPALVEGPFAQRFFRQTSIAWFFAPACALAVVAELSHTAVEGYRIAPMQVAAPYLGTLALGLAAWSWRRPVLVYLGAVVLTLGNIHAVRTAVGDRFLEEGLSRVHLICLGFALTVVETWLLRPVAWERAVVVVLARAGVAAAGCVFVLLVMNYAVHPDLDSISWARFVTSGAMAYLAGLYFRFCAHRGEPGGDAAVRWWYGLYHFGVTMAIWCAALLIPWLRSPHAALWALGLPVLYFYLRAESGMRFGSPTATRYRTSAAVLGFAILGLYASRSIFQMVLFPDEPIRTDHYHHNSFFVMLLSLVLLRLNGLGGTSWLAFYGGLALMAGSFFALTMFPGLSPFERPIPSAWCALALAHLWTLVSSQRSPLRTAIREMAAIDDQTWRGLRRSWGLCLLAACHGAVLWGLVDYRSNTLMVAPLLAGAATVFIHHGVLRRSPLFFVLAGIEIVAALHADFLVPSYLPADHVIWVLVGLWAAALAASGFSPLRITPRHLGWFAAALAVGIFAHALYHHPGSPAGLWAVALGGILASLTPRPDRVARSAPELIAATCLLAVPAWLVYFSQSRIREAGLDAALEAWPVLTAATAVFATGSLARVFQSHLRETYATIDRPRPRLFDQTLAWLGSFGFALNSVTLWVAIAGAAAVQVLNYNTALDRSVFTLLLLLYAGSSLAWYFEGRLRQRMIPYIALQFSVFALFALLRRQLMLTTDFWSHEHDVWTSLVVSAGLAGSKRFIDAGPRAARTPLLGTLFALPVATMAWVLIQGLGSNIALVVVGLHSVLFAFLAKDDRESPYAIISVVGFVTFVLLAFWTKLELRVVHAYVIPVGLGVLVLLQLLRDRIDVAARNGVRFVTLLAMLGSAGYYALLDSRFPIAFILTFGLLCLFAMGLGGFLRVRLYLLLGFGGLLVDLAAVLYRVLVHMERGPRMTLIGSLILLVGAALVFGAIFYKTHKSEVDARLARWRRHLDSWE